MAESFSVTSPQLKQGARIAKEQLFNQYGCRGANLSPALEWHNPPPGTKSFAVTVHDRDVPNGSDFWHWVIFNIPAQVSSLATGAGDPLAHLAPPGAVQLRNDFGQPGYGGPCPPPGDKPHHYEFTVYALKFDQLPLDENAQAATVLYHLNEQLLDKTVLLATYGR